MSTSELISMILSGVCCFGLFCGLLTLILGTVFKTRFGINLGKTRCGECGKAAPGVRDPQDTYEVLWGGWTCQKCGCKNDKWGNPR